MVAYQISFGYTLVKLAWMSMIYLTSCRVVCYCLPMMSSWYQLALSMAKCIKIWKLHSNCRTTLTCRWMHRSAHTSLSADLPPPACTIFCIREQIFNSDWLFRRPCLLLRAVNLRRKIWKTLKQRLYFSVYSLLFMLCFEKCKGTFLTILDKEGSNKNIKIISLG